MQSLLSWMACSGLALAGLSAKAESDLTAGLELRLPGQFMVVPGNWHSDWTLDGNSQIPGEVEGLSIGLSIPSIQVRPAGLGLVNPRLEIRLAHWRYSKAPILDIECRNLRADLSPALLQVPWVDGLAVEWHRGDDGLASTTVAGPLENSLDSVLRNLLSPSTLNSSLHVQGDCPGDGVKIIEAALRSRLANWPDKDPTRWAQLRSSASDWAREAAGKGAAKVLDRLPRQGAWSARFTLQPANSETWVLRGGQNPSKDFLSPNVRAVLAARPANPQVIIGSTFLQDAGRLALTKLLGESVELKQTVSAEDLRAYLPELETLSANSVLHFRFRPLGCVEDVESLQLLPWLSSSGMDRGLDLLLAPVLEVVDAAGNDVARRRFPLELRFALPRMLGPDDAPILTFQGGRWRSEETNLGSCAMQPLPPELGTTVDWVLNSAMVQDFAREKLATQSMGAWSRAWSRLTVLGQASAGARRGAGGYYGEAFLLDLRP